MIDQNLQNVTHHQNTKVIPVGGEPVDVKIYGDFLRVEAVSGDIYWQINGGSNVVAKLGATMQGVVGRSDIQFVRFVNLGASSVTVTVSYGRGAYQVTGAVTGVVSIATDSLGAITPDTTARTPGFTSALAGSTTYTAKRSIQIVNTGAAAITVNATTLPPGNSVSWSVFRHQDTLADITVDATGSTAFVTWLN